MRSLRKHTLFADVMVSYSSARVILCLLLLSLTLGPVCAAPLTEPAPSSKPTPPIAPASSNKPAPPTVPTPSSKPAPIKPPAAAPLPDYGGRDSAPIAVGDAAPNPLGQAWRALEALVIVLAGVIGVVYGLKRFGLVTPGTDGKPARITLPGGPGFQTFAGLGRSASAASAAVSFNSSLVTVVSSQSLPGGTMLHVVTVAGRTLLLAATSHAVTTVAEWPAEPETAKEAAAFDEYLARADAAPTPPEPGSIAAANARLRSLLSRPSPEESSL